MCTETLLLYNFVSKAVEKAPVRFNKGSNSRETPRGFSPQIQKNQNLKNLARRSSSVDNSGQEVIESRDQACKPGLYGAKKHIQKPCLYTTAWS